MTVAVEAVGGGTTIDGWWFGERFADGEAGPGQRHPDGGGPAKAAGRGLGVPSWPRMREELTGLHDGGRCRRCGGRMRWYAEEAESI